MNIRSKILFSTMVGAVVTAQAVLAIAVSGTKSIIAIAAIVSAFCVIAAVVGQCIANCVAKSFNDAVTRNRDGALRQATVNAPQVPGAGAAEEMSQRLAEISSLILRNADNANHAKSLAAEALVAANAGDAAVKRIEKAVNWIKASSDNNAKIIKAVNYMAHRARILALNAAVKTAHAGEAGKVFAATANEMRNFALRCAMAAKNTADMLEESAKEADDGVKITEDAARSIGKIVDRTGEVGNLIAGIAEASNEQAQGVKRMKAAVAWMNWVTRRDAAYTEWSVRAGERLNDQTQEQADTADDFIPNESKEICAADQSGRRNLSARQRYAAFPYEKPYSATTLAFWTPVRVENAEEMPTIDDYERWR